MAVSLIKGQKISLAKEGDQELSEVFMGLGWDAVEKPKSGFLSGLLGGGGGDSIDLDASCVLFDAGKNLVDAVYFGQLRSKDGSVRHSGDNLTGDGDGDDEVIHVNLGSVPAKVTSLVFIITSYQGQNFNQVKNAFCRLVNAKNNQEIAKYDLTGGANCTAQIMTRVYRHNGEWKMAAIGEAANGRTFQDVVPNIKAFL